MKIHLRIRHTLLLFLLVSGIPSVWSQYTSAEESDPEARKILDRIAEKLENNAAYSAQFTLEIEYPGEKSVVQEGKIIQQGDQFRLDLGEYLMIANTDSRWVYFKPENTVSLYKADAEGGWKTPVDFIRIYASDEFVFSLLPDQMTTDPGEYWIEFKPLEESAEYAKVRMQIDKKALEVNSIKTFGKDGSSYILRLQTLQYLRAQPPATFQFNPDDYPGIKIEDLRID